LMRLGQASIREVGPRDGLQSWPTPVSTEDKARIIAAIAAAGVARIEVTSFVSSRMVPQLADAEALVARLPRPEGVRYEALALSGRGVERAIAAGVHAVVLVLAASETFNRRNAGRSIDASLQTFQRLRSAAAEAGVHALAVIGTAFGCPYEGRVTIGQVQSIIERFAALGISEVVLADTTGIAVPPQIEDTMRKVIAHWPDVTFGLHLHNTRGLGLANVCAGLRAGVVQYDTSIGGIGGCPFAPKASGNVATEDTLHLLHELGLKTSIDLDKLIAAAQFAERILGRELPGQVMKAGPRSRRSTTW